MLHHCVNQRPLKISISESSLEFWKYFNLLVYIRKSQNRPQLRLSIMKQQSEVKYDPLTDRLTRCVFCYYFWVVSWDVPAHLQPLVDLRHNSELDLGKVGVVDEHMNSGLKAALHWRNKDTSNVDVWDLVSVLLALVNPYWMKIWINEICVAFKRLNQLAVVIESIFFDCNLFVVELTETVADKEDIGWLLV